MKKKELSSKPHLSLLLLSLSSLSKTQYPLKSTLFLPFLTPTLSSSSSTILSTKLTTILTLYNLSTKLENSKPIIECGVITPLISLVANETTSEAALATLTNLSRIPLGRKSIENDLNLVDSITKALTFEKCQELATQLLMIVVHASTSGRKERMSRSEDMVPVLLEVALVGPTEVARRRATKLLEWFRDARGGVVHSGPQERWVPRSEEEGEGVVGEERRMVRSMVKQSLIRSMVSITRRATGIDSNAVLKSFVASSSSKSFVASSSSKSLPY